MTSEIQTCVSGFPFERANLLRSHLEIRGSNRQVVYSFTNGSFHTSILFDIFFQCKRRKSDRHDTAAKEAGLTTEELLQSIQASESELFDALKRSCAIKLNDKFEMENIYM